MFEEGYKLILYLIVVAKSGDIGAYLIGSKFGKHSLIPRISPKKSIEGALGGLVFSMICSIVIKDYLGWSVLKSLTCGVCIGMFAQFGDLAESLIKRDYQVKDSSPILPGLGGLLDVIDSILFSAPVFYIFLILSK